MGFFVKPRDILLQVAGIVVASVVSQVVLAKLNQGSSESGEA